MWKDPSSVQQYREENRKSYPKTQRGAILVIILGIE